MFPRIRPAMSGYDMDSLSERCPMKPYRCSNGMQFKRKWATPCGAAQALVLFFACFLSAALARQCFFHALLLAGFQVKGVTLDLLDDVFLLYLAFKTAERILEGLALLKSYFCQLTT